MSASRTAGSTLPPARSVIPLAAVGGLRASVVRDGPGLVEAAAQDDPRLAIHMGKPVRMRCMHGGERHLGLAIHGDIDIIPAGMPSSWEMAEPDAALVLTLPLAYLRAMAEAAGRDGGRVRIESRFRARDAQIEHVGWALLAEAEAGFPSGMLYLESLAAALAARLLRGYGGVGFAAARRGGGLGERKLRRVRAYVEEHLAERITLAQAAGVAELGLSQFKAGFRRAAGMPFHQYVIRRRVERAAALLRGGQVSISEAALEAGFCHPSHLAARMRRLLGTRPRELTCGGE